MRKLLSSLFTKGRPGVNQSWFLKKERHQWLACDSNKSLSKNERFAKKHTYFLNVFYSFHPFYGKEWIAPIAFCSVFFYFKSDETDLLFRSVALFKRATGAMHSCYSLKKSNCEGFAPIALYKRATMSNLLLLLMTKEWREWFAHFHEQFALSLTKIDWFAWKTDERIPNPVIHSLTDIII